MGKLEEYKYYYMHRRCEATAEVQDLFFAHPTSIELLRAFPQVLLMDCTYKTNIYRLPLLHIVGVTSTGLTFCVACAFLEAEKEDNYSWACQTLRVLMDEHSLPNVIVTDREKALMNAIEGTFPQTTNLLCRWHINKNLLANCKKHVLKKGAWEGYIAQWNMVVHADSEEMFKIQLQRFQSDFDMYPEMVKYPIKQWLEPYKDKFVAYITDNIKHYGNQTSSRYI